MCVQLQITQRLHTVLVLFLLVLDVWSCSLLFLFVLDVWSCSPITWRLWWPCQYLTLTSHYRHTHVSHLLNGSNRTLNIVEYCHQMALLRLREALLPRTWLSELSVCAVHSHDSICGPKLPKLLSPNNLHSYQSRQVICLKRFSNNNPFINWVCLGTLNMHCGILLNMLCFEVCLFSVNSNIWQLTESRYVSI